MAEKETEWVLDAQGSVEIFIHHYLGKETQVITMIYGTSAAELEEKAQQYLDTKLSPILSADELKRVGYSIRFGMHPVCRYKEAV